MLMMQISDWLTKVEKKYGKNVRMLAFKELRFWDPFANTQTFFTTKTLESFEKDAIEKNTIRKRSLIF